MTPRLLPVTRSSFASGADLGPASRHASSLSSGAFALPALPCRGERQDVLSPLQRRALVGAILTGHVAVIWGLLQIREVRDAVVDAAPMFVSLIAPPPPEPPPPEPVPVVPPPPVIPPPPVPIVKPPPAARPVAKRPPRPSPVIAAPPAPQPARPVFVVPEPAPVVAPIAPTPSLAPVIVAAPAPVPAPPAPPAPPPPVVEPKIIPASAVEYLEAPVLEYPRLSQRAGETGRVLIRVFIDPAGLAKDVQVNQSSGHARLDAAALAAVKRARFKPYTENGRPVAGWAFIPLDFQLER